MNELKKIVDEMVKNGHKPKGAELNELMMLSIFQEIVPELVEYVGKDDVWNKISNNGKKENPPTHVELSTMMKIRIIQEQVSISSKSLANLLVRAKQIKETKDTKEIHRLEYNAKKSNHIDLYLKNILNNIWNNTYILKNPNYFLNEFIKMMPNGVTLINDNNNYTDSLYLLDDNTLSIIVSELRTNYHKYWEKWVFKIEYDNNWEQMVFVLENKLKKTTEPVSSKGQWNSLLDGFMKVVGWDCTMEYKQKEEIFVTQLIFKRHPKVPTI